MAERLKQEAGADRSETQVRRAFALAYSREPAADEIAAAVALIGQHGLRAFCRAMLNSNEMMYLRRTLRHPGSTYIRFTGSDRDMRRSRIDLPLSGCRCARRFRHAQSESEPPHGTRRPRPVAARIPGQRLHRLGGNRLGPPARRGSACRGYRRRVRSLRAWQPGLGRTHFPAKARRVLQVFCPGAASHMDLWEHKPALEKYHGQPLPGAENFVSFQGKNGNLMKSPWPFVAGGQSGKMISSLLPHMARHVDDIAFIHSMTSKTNTHGPGCVFMNTGHVQEGFPSAGAWVSYALGSANENLPTYVAIPDIRGEPPNGKANWSNGFLPAQHQAMVMSAQQPIRNLQRPGERLGRRGAATREFLRHAERAPCRSEPGQFRTAGPHGGLPTGGPHAAVRAGGHRPGGGARIDSQAVRHRRRQSAEGRVRPQLPARPPAAGTGVRYVNLYCASRASGVDGLLNWDAHKTLKADYERHCPIFDQPTAALLTDLKQRGLLDDTLVLWTTEFGRMPTHQAGTTGRDHNPDGFTCWMMGPA